MHHCVHHYIENFREHRAPLSHPPKTLELFSVISARVRHHYQYVPIGTEDTEIPRPHSVTLQDIQAYVPVKGVSLVKFQKYILQDLLPHGC